MSETTDQQAPPADVIPTLGSVDEYLQFCVQYDASDLHLATGSQPTWRRYGNLQPIWNNAAVLTAADTQRLAHGFLGEVQRKMLEERGDVDFAYSPPHGRFRASVVKQRLGLGKPTLIVLEQPTGFKIHAPKASAAPHVDPAISEKPSACDCAFAVVGMRTNGQLVVLEVSGDRAMTPREQINEYFRLFRKCK